MIQSVSSVINGGTKCRLRSQKDTGKKPSMEIIKYISIRFQTTGGRRREDYIQLRMMR